MSDIVERLREAAEQAADNRRVAEFGPVGGNPAAKAEEHLEWKAADEIERLQAEVERLEAERDKYKTYWQDLARRNRHDPYSFFQFHQAEAKKRIAELEAKVKRLKQAYKEGIPWHYYNAVESEDE